MSQSITIENQLGNTFSIHFVYPEINPRDYIQNITDVLCYTGVFDGIVKSSTPTSQVEINR